MAFEDPAAAPMAEHDGGEPATTEQVKRFLQAHPRASQDAVRKGVDGRATDVDAALALLIERGEIADDGRGNRHAYSLAEAVK